jgi:hypothetical protein
MEKQLEEIKKDAEMASLFYTGCELGGCAARHAAQNRNQHISHIVSRANITCTGGQGGHPHFLIRNAVCAYDGNLRKIPVQALDIGQSPVLDVDDHSFRAISGNVVPQFFVGRCDMYREVTA